MELALLSCRTIGVVSVAFVTAGVWAADEATDRPKIGLALSGGGAKGGAHVGVLQVLEELHIPVDYIAGTSMGAVVGGLYAAGMSAEQLEDVLHGIDWDDAISDNPPRRDLTFRRKEDTRRYTVKLELGFRKGKIVWPASYLAGQKLYFILQALTLPVSHVTDFDDLSIPFRCVATDIQTGDPVVLDHGNLATAIRASMAIPSIFAPVEWEDRTLVDGGITNNLPIDVVREMGADIVIAVDLGAPLTSRDVRSMLQIRKQLTRIQIRKNVESQLGRADLVIRPPVSDRGMLDFDVIEENMRLGAEATEAEADRLRAWSIDAETHGRWLETHVLPPAAAPVVSSIRLEGNRRVDTRVVRAKLSIKPGDTFDYEILYDNISRIYALGDFQQISFSIEGTGEQVGLVIEMIEKPWGPNYMRFGASVDGDLQGNLRAGALVNLTLRRLNALGAESRNDFQLGTRRLIQSEFYQPLDYHGWFFVAPRLGADWDRKPVFVDGKNIADLDTRLARFGLDLGYNIPRWGEIRLGYDGAEGNAKAAAGFVPPGAELDDVDVGAIRLKVTVDRLDNVNVPRRGPFLEYESLFSRESLGSDADYDRHELQAGYWYTKRKNTIFGTLQGGRVNRGTLPLYSEFTIGGLFSLSGFALDELRGRYYGVARLGYYRHVTKQWFLGGWAELGNAWLTRDEVAFNTLLLTGTLFLGADTIVGPAYLAYGLAEGGHQRLYIVLGRTF